MDEVVIKECMLQFPDASSEVEAVDLAAQAVHRQIRENYTSMDFKTIKKLSSKYNYLHLLREELAQKRIADMSSFVVLN